jgi:hypothetical protein
VKNASKTLSARSGGNPIPLSLTEINSWFSEFDCDLIARSTATFASFITNHRISFLAHPTILSRFRNQAKGDLKPQGPSLISPVLSTDQILTTCRDTVIQSLLIPAKAPARTLTPLIAQEMSSQPVIASWHLRCTPDSGLRT